MSGFRLFPTIHGENLVLRLLDMSAGIYTLDSLGMDVQDMAKIESMCQKPYGMILSTGPTGSGKSTSLYAILNAINKPDINIVTLEDPVEYRVNDIRQVQLNTKAGMTFASGLRSILRQDPDVIMCAGGNQRMPETASCGSGLRRKDIGSYKHRSCTMIRTGVITPVLSTWNWNPF
jgi:type IV pilus assembly protein PilB